MTPSDPDPATTPIRQGEPTYRETSADHLAQRSKARVEREEGRRSPSPDEAGVPARAQDLGGQAEPGGEPGDPAAPQRDSR